MVAYIRSRLSLDLIPFGHVGEHEVGLKAMPNLGRPGRRTRPNPQRSGLPWEICRSERRMYGNA